MNPSLLWIAAPEKTVVNNRTAILAVFDLGLDIPAELFGLPPRVRFVSLQNETPPAAVATESVPEELGV